MQSVFNNVWVWLHVWLSSNSVRLQDKCEGLIMINLLSLQNELPSRSKIKKNRKWDGFSFTNWQNERKMFLSGAPCEWLSQVSTQMTQNGMERISLTWLYSSLSQKYLCSKSQLLKSLSKFRKCLTLIQTSPSKGFLREIVSGGMVFSKDWWNH